MATYDYFRTINFTTTSTDYDLLQDTNVRDAIKERFGGISDAELDVKLAEGIRDMSFSVYVSGTSVSVNGETAYPPLADEVVSSGDYIRRPVKTIEVSSNGISGQFRFNIL